MRYRARPGHFFGSIGLVSGFFGGLVLFWLAIEKFLMGEDIGTRPALLVGVVLVITAFQFVTTGVLAEMISRTQYDSSDNNHYIIRHTHSNQVD